MRRTMWSLLMAGFLVSGAAQADKPSWAGEKADNPGIEKHKKKDVHRETAHPRQEARPGQGRGHFEAQHRQAVQEYYAESFRAGRCPPGLAKKRNGCQPPGQARKWVVGRPLPADVRYYSVPSQLVVRLGPPPAGHRYVRVAADILLIAVGTGMVVDAIQDLSGR